MTEKTTLNLPPPFDEAMRRYEREMMRFILRSTGDQGDTLDLFQETWLRAYRAYPKFNSLAELRPWLYRVATNLCLNRARDRRRHLRTVVPDDGSAVNVRSYDGSHDDLLDLKATISRLPQKQRQALVMRKVAGLEYAEIAAALGCSEEAARAGVYQALKKLNAAR